MSRLKRHTVHNRTNQMVLFNEVETKTEFIADWTEAEILHLQRAMLIHAIQEIRDRRRSRVMRIEAWDWLMSDEDHGFSSSRCASNNGYDIKHLRWLMKRLINDL